MKLVNMLYLYLVDDALQLNHASLFEPSTMVFLLVAYF